MTAMSGVPGNETDTIAWSEQDRLDVSAWLLREADQRVHLFPQRRDGVDALMRHLADRLASQPQNQTQLAATNGDVWADHGHPRVPCAPPDAVHGEVPCRLRAALATEDPQP